MSGLTMQDLVDNPSFGMSVLAGSDNLEAVVRWVHISTTTEMTPWIEFGDFVLTNGRNLPPSRSAQYQLISELRRRGAAALAIGSVEGPSDIEGLREGAEVHGLALVWVDRSVSWGALGRAVADANDSGMRAGLRDQIRIFETLEARVNGEISFTAALRLQGRITGHDFYLVNRVGQPAIGGLPALPDELAYTLQEPGPLVQDGFVMPVRLGGFTIATLIARQVRTESSGLTAIRHVATLAATELAQQQQQREATRRIGADLFARLRAGTLHGAAAEQAVHELGLGDPPWTLARIDAPPAGDTVSGLLADGQIPHLMLTDEQAVHVLVNGTDESVWKRVAEATGAIVALSGPVDALGDLALAERQAAWAGRRAADGGLNGVIGFAATVDAVGWLPTDRRALAALVRATLGPIIENDREHNGALLETLRAYLNRDRSVTAVAADLFVHRQTVNHRLRRIQELTGKDLHRLSTVSELWIALNAYDVVRGDLPFARE